MNAAYEFVVGPLAWIAGAIFVLGSIYRLVSMYALAVKKDYSSLPYMDLKYSLRSIIHWLNPFGTAGWKASPWTAAVTFIFHICLIITPLFLLGHAVLLETFHGIEWPTISDGLADGLTMLVIAGCIFFIIRRATVDKLKYITSGMDWFVIFLVLATFLTGFAAYHQWLNYQFILILHILAGEAMLASIPFTRLSHMIFWVFIRGYMGSEFGKVRHAKDW
ncbi:MAG: hypothetical protein PWQ57_1510 [Desulfovibrionales bacterium]|nr:hypothetical protein [Desulfovibrionales bacterium]